MKYQILDAQFRQQYTQQYTQSYVDAINSGFEKCCLIGKEAKYRMNARDSILTQLTDQDVLLKYCLYPLYHDGDQSIGARIESYLKELVESEDIICIYQVVNFIYTQDQFIESYEDLPFVINVKEVVPLLVGRIEKLSDKMKVFREGEFGLYPATIYEMIQGMMKNSASFHYL